MCALEPQRCHSCRYNSTKVRQFDPPFNPLFARCTRPCDEAHFVPAQCVPQAVRPAGVDALGALAVMCCVTPQREAHATQSSQRARIGRVPLEHIHLAVGANKCRPISARFLQGRDCLEVVRSAHVLAVHVDARAAAVCAIESSWQRRSPTLAVVVHELHALVRVRMVQQLPGGGIQLSQICLQRVRGAALCACQLGTSRLS